MGRGRQALHQKVLLHFAFPFYIVQFKIILFRDQFLKELNLPTRKASMVHVVPFIPHTALAPFFKIRHLIGCITSKHSSKRTFVEQ